MRYFAHLLGVSVKALTGVKVLVWLLWPSTSQAKPRSNSYQPLVHVGIAFKIVCKKCIEWVFVRHLTKMGLMHNSANIKATNQTGHSKIDLCSSWWHLKFLPSSSSSTIQLLYTMLPAIVYTREVLGQFILWGSPHPQESHGSFLDNFSFGALPTPRTVSSPFKKNESSKGTTRDFRAGVSPK